MPERNNEPGIRFTGIAVDRVRFDDVHVGEKPPKDLSFEFAIRRKSWETPAAVDITVSVRAVPSDSEESPSHFSLEVSVTGRFEAAEESPNVPLDQFAKFNGPAQVIPFVREFVANLTARSRRGLVLIPPMNVIALLEREAQQAAVDETPAGR
jgi:preprotein translocase subunit SecB